MLSMINIVAAMMPGVVLLILVIAITIRPRAGAALAQVLTASASPLRAIVPWDAWGRREQSSDGDSQTKEVGS